MANIKISQLPAKGANLGAQDLVEVAEFTGTGYVSKSITGQEIIDAASGGGATWGSITGTLSSQTDLQTALDEKETFIGQEPLDFTTDIPLNRFILTPQASAPLNVMKNMESVSTNVFQNFGITWQSYAALQASLIPSIAGFTYTWSYLTINNENLATFNFPFTNASTITINSTYIDRIQQFGTNGTYILPNCTQLNNNITLDTNAPVSFTANNLISLGGSLTIGGSTWSMNSLENIYGSLGFNTGVASVVSIPTLKRCTSLLGPSASSATLTNLTLNGLEVVFGAINFTSATASFTTFSFNNIKEVTGNFTTSTTIGFTQSTVDHILVKLAEMDGTGGKGFYANRIVTVRGAAPSATGNAAKATLIARGCTVTTS